ncbi:MAG TPA: malto-oligosyltrehalose synthase [Acidiferrobacterales bacterium]
MDTALLDRLCRLYGIDTEFTDIWGERHHVAAEDLSLLLAAMGVDIHDGDALAAALARREALVWKRCLAPVRVVRAAEGAPQIGFTLPATRAGETLHWRLDLESGEGHAGELRPADLPRDGSQDLDGTRYERYLFTLPIDAPLGYHRFQLRADGAALSGDCQRLIVTPATCHVPDTLRDGRAWGPAVQLYGLRSARNWGMGDYTDLAEIAAGGAALGAATVGVNPLHAMFPHNPEHASPYSPSSRLFLNILYIDVEALPEYRESPAAQQWVGDPDFQARLAVLRDSALVDYRGVAAAKLPPLARLFHFFGEHDLAAGTGSGRAFRAFQDAGGEDLFRHALYEALQAHFHRQDPALWGWPVWPEDYRHPESPAVAAFADAHAEQVEFYQYLQWCADRQLGAAAARARDAGMALGLYQDLAVGVDRGGAETWSHQVLFALEAAVGAPPDDFNLHGQNWGLPPFIPTELREQAYAPFIATLRAAMRHAGALRIDHVMGLMRLFWVPPGRSAAHGAYVLYPFEDLLGILALESRRNECVVIGEDLGTVPDAVREAMTRYRILSYRLLYFSKDAHGQFLTPDAFPAQALAAVSTHDLPTVAGFWQGRDLQERAELGLFPSAEQRDRQILGRAEDRARLLFALEREGLLPEGMTTDPASSPEMTPQLARAIHRYVARAPARIMLVQLEDVLGQWRQVNLPGTTDERPNWRLKLDLELGALSGDERLVQMAAALRAERAPLPAPLPAAAVAQPVELIIPSATYRLQFNKDFRFVDAARLAPYLARLGMSHCYASPYLKARAGSPHGYDIVDHNALNPEIGSPAEYEQLVQALRTQGLGQVLDIVPNHMGVGGDDNAWWLDVLENGPASLYAGYFDIDWWPAKEELLGKVLLPVLGNHYGKVLEAGELKLAFDAERGGFSVRYYGHCFPIDPRSYPRILSFDLERLEGRLGGDDPRLIELHSLITALRNLPARDDTEPQRTRDRARDGLLHKKRLAELCQAHRDLREFVAGAAAVFNGRGGGASGYDALHALLEEQAYRLSYWRVAADEINYRRFFEINDLAGLRQEVPEVFAATHRFIIELVRHGKVTGLRIDHPDGLHDPLQYYRRLQASIAAGQPVTQEAGAAPVAPRAYVTVEKILASYERLPEDWPVHGTTGYEFANLVNGLLVYAPAERAMLRAWQRFARLEVGFDDLLYERKKLVMKLGLSSEVNVLANYLDRLSEPDWHTRDFTRIALRDALMEVVACFPVYRTYISAAGVSAEDRRYVEWAIAQAKRRNPAMEDSIFDFIRDVLLVAGTEGRAPDYRAAVLSFAMRFQQYSAPVMAKGLEDTTFYIYNPLVSLNEVGGDPRRFSVSPAAFHRANQERLRRWPHTLLSTSTHDTKRSEDVRARIDVLSELPETWRAALARWARINRSRKLKLDTGSAPSRNDEYLLYQTLIGIWPAGEPDAAALVRLRKRVTAYMIKAVREAKVHTSWINPNADYERALTGFVQALLDEPERNPFLADFRPLAREAARCGYYNSLSQTLLKLTAPGVPDIYQGNELWDFSLVDPDNRRPVDYARREALLAELEGWDREPDQLAGRAHGLLDSLDDGRAKLHLTRRLLNFRRDHWKRLRDADYQPLAVGGERADHVCAFARTRDDLVLVVVASRWHHRLTGGDCAAPLGALWGDTAVTLPAPMGRGPYRNLLTGERIDAVPREDGAILELATLFAHFPAVALLHE